MCSDIETFFSDRQPGTCAICLWMASYVCGFIEIGDSIYKLNHVCISIKTTDAVKT